MQYQFIKKRVKNLIKIIEQISLLPILSKTFEKLIFNSLFNYFMQNKLFTEYQSWFIPDDSCTVQLYKLQMKSIKTLIVTHQLI